MEEFLARVAAMSFHAWLNFLIAGTTMLVALGAANKMNKDTEVTIVIAFATVGAGMLGTMLGYFSPDRWQLSFDTILYGGVLSLLIGTRRRTIWMKPEWMPRFSLWVSALTWATFFWTAH